MESHPKIEKVLHPFSNQHPQVDLAKKQMTGCGGLFSFLVKADTIEDVEGFCDRLKCFLMACSWGGHESLVFPTCALYNSDNYKNSEIPWNLVRMYVGLEESALLIEDISQALGD